MIRADLKSIVDIQVGYQAKARIKERVRGTHRLIQSKDFDPLHRLQIEGLTTFLPERNPEIYSVGKEDILFQARGVEHFAHCIEDDLQNTLAAGSFYILRMQSEDLLPQYLAWWLNQSKAQAWLRAQARGTGISFISKHTLSRLQVRIPPLSVQNKVVKIVTLANREQFLLERLAQTRSGLVKAACLKAIQEQER
jgi:restriction endonuclease S subunit